MLVAELPEKTLQQQRVQVLCDDAQNAVYIEITLGNGTFVGSENLLVSDSVFLVFQLPALFLLLEFDPNILQLWLGVLDLSEFYVYFADSERDRVLSLIASLQEMGLRKSGVVLGVPAVKWDELMLCFKMSETGF